VLHGVKECVQNAVLASVRNIVLFSALSFKFFQTLLVHFLFVDRHLRSYAAILQLCQRQKCTLSFSHDPRHNNPQDLSQEIWEAKVQAHLHPSIVHHIFELDAVSQLEQNVPVHIMPKPRVLTLLKEAWKNILQKPAVPLSC
jgi:hypothetical protein